MPLNLPKVMTDFYPLMGGLDLESPAIAISPGKLFDAQNYEPNTSGGYRRIDGYERMDGRNSPTSADYVSMQIAYGLESVLVPGVIVRNQAGTASAKVLGYHPPTLVLSRMSGSFSVGDVLTL